MMRYAVIIEKAANNYGAYVPDIPGCVTTGTTPEEVECLMKEAIAFHLEGLKEDGLPIPEPTSLCAYVEVESVQPLGAANGPS